MERLTTEGIEALQELYRQQKKIFSHAKELQISRHSMKEVLEDVCRGIASIMDCERVSIWLFDEESNKMTAQNVYNGDQSYHYSGNEITRDRYPSYFRAIEQERVLAIEDIHNHPATSELKEWYHYHDNSIWGLMDATIILSRGLGGVLCCETTKERTWTSLDKVLVASIADMVSFIFDRMQRMEMEDYVRRLAYTDLLTGLHNEYSFMEQVSGKLQKLEKGQRGLFIYMVLDQFDEIQSVLGPDIASQLIRLTGERLLTVFPEPAVTARIAFDHFLIYSPYDGDTDEEMIVRRMELIGNELRRPVYIHGQEVHLTFSYGVSMYPDLALDVHEGIQTSMLALQSGRRKMKRRVRSLYDKRMHNEMKEALFSEMNLRKGLENREFLLHYQPQVDREGRLTGFEALIRWRHPERGLIYPGDFIDLAESTGLIIPLGEWVIQEATRQLAVWHHAGCEDLTVSVNLSPRHFLQPNFPFYLQKCVDGSGIFAHHVKLEITENVALENPMVVEKRISVLRDLGFVISIDDFGKGYSAFSYLKQFTVQEIKIDRQFINEIGDDSKGDAIVQTIIHLARLLKLDPLAEGVETAEQWEQLKLYGCNAAQGYYFSRPVPAAEIDGLLASCAPGSLPILPIITAAAY